MFSAVNVCIRFIFICDFFFLFISLLANKSQSAGLWEPAMFFSFRLCVHLSDTHKTARFYSQFDLYSGSHDAFAILITEKHKINYIIFLFFIVCKNVVNIKITLKSISDFQILDAFLGFHTMLIDVFWVSAARNSKRISKFDERKISASQLNAIDYGGEGKSHSRIFSD